MTPEEGIEVRSLNKMLRDGDPAARDAGLTDAERHRIRARLAALEPVRQQPGVFRWLVPAVAVSVVAAIVLVVSVNWPADRSDFRAARTPAPSSEPTLRPERHELRQVRFVTGGGTQVIWLLDARPAE